MLNSLMKDLFCRLVFFLFFQQQSDLISLCLNGFNKRMVYLSWESLYAFDTLEVNVESATCLKREMLN